jgi:hypothetical protein
MAEVLLFDLAIRALFLLPGGCGDGSGTSRSSLTISSIRFGMLSIAPHAFATFRYNFITPAALGGPQ